MAKYRNKPNIIEATQWFKNGDHPEDDVWRPYNDGVAMAPGTVPKEPREGAVVRYYRHPSVDGQSLCSKCGKKMRDHGWIDLGADGLNVCPGDWIITGAKVPFYPCKPDIFADTYEPA